MCETLVLRKSMVKTVTVYKRDFINKVINDFHMYQNSSAESLEYCFMSN